MLIELIVGLAALAAAPAGQNAQALYDRGVTWQTFYDAADVRRELWQRNTERVRASLKPELVDRLKRAGEGLRLLAVAEASCSDSVNTIPFIAELASRAGIDMRIVGREAGEPVLEHHRTPDGRLATPTVVLLRDGRDVGAWVERPSVLQAWFISSTDIPVRERVERKMSWYEWDRGASTIADFLAVVEAASGR
jgi:hypothetical protein